uniref:Uncharacterized protein n=1 Tax=Anguilla anguilla TaxID=7936 RepID=A0A0E9RXS4_ANGAN
MIGRRWFNLNPHWLCEARRHFRTDLGCVLPVFLLSLTGRLRWLICTPQLRNQV